MRLTGRVLVLLPLAAVLCAASTALAADSSSDACRAGTKRAVIGGKVKCLKAGQVCKARYQAAYRRAGFTCVAGHLRKRTSAPPPAPSPPAVLPGHYKGTTSQLTVIEFDVSADSSAVLNLSTGQVNQGCTPGLSLSGGGIASASAAIASDGTFRIAFGGSTKIGDDPGTFAIELTGHFSGASAIGTLQENTNLTRNGTAYACGSGLQSWTASRVG